MKTLLFSLLFVFAGASVATAQELNLKKDDATIQFNVKAEKVTGTITGLSATLKFDPSNPDKSSMSGSVRVASITTGNSKRDEHLKSSDYFDAKKFPLIKFESTKIEKSGDYYLMTGKLTIKDVTKEVKFRIKVEDDSVVGQASIYAQDFGLMKDKDRDETKTLIKITVPKG